MVAAQGSPVPSVDRLPLAPVLIPGLARAAAVLLVLAVVAVSARAIGWYPREFWGYVVVGALFAFSAGVGSRIPRIHLVLVAVVVGWPWWSFGVGEVRVLPLILAGYLAVAAGAPFSMAAAVATVSSAFGLFLFAVPRFDYLPRAAVPDAMIDFFVGRNPSSLFLSFVIVAAAVLLGRSAARRRQSLALLRQRNEELERLRAGERDRAAAEERARLAREVHDTVAHHMAALTIRAQAVAHVADQRPELLAPTLRWVAASSQEALSAMRETVRGIRGDVDPNASPDIAVELGEIVARVGEAGLVVDTRLDELPGIDPIRRLALVRVAQEALTNVLLHSAAPTARLSLHRVYDSVVLTVADDGDPADGGAARPRPTGIVSGGSGLPGMRERASDLGGTVEAGADGAGWIVRMRLPLTTELAASSAVAVDQGASP